MGQVFRATDTKLKRQVAIKILPPSLAADHDRLARFQREAEVLASLNHPNIAAIYGLEESAGMTALVMELVEGDDLSQRIARDAIPIDEALPIAKQIAEALEAAHEQGIIHRDLKPANIKVRPDGTVKVLDFGLAKAMEAPGMMSPGVSQAPTITSPAMMTGVGMILGTAAYMSPEQARGKAVDKRADIWAFGAVLFEMLTGRRAFEAEDISMTLSMVLQRDPDFAALPPSVPARVSQVLRVCLRKDPKQRVGDIRDVRLGLEGAFETAAPQTGAAANAPGGRLAWMAFAGALLAAAVLVIPAVRHLREAPPSLPPEMRFEIATPSTTEPSSIAISPNGSAVVYVARSEGVSRLWLRTLQSDAARELAGTEGALRPFWSPDGGVIGFHADRKLKRVNLDDGFVQVVTDSNNTFGSAWAQNGSILFAPTSSSGLYLWSPDDAEPRRVESTVEGGRFPDFLPNGRDFIYYVRRDTDSGVYVGSLGRGESRRLVEADASAVYSTSGHLLFVREGTLFAQAFDPEALSLRGDPLPIAQGITVDSSGHAALAASSAGPVIYRTGAANLARQYVWFDRTGRELERVGDIDRQSRGNPALAPEGDRIAYERFPDDGRPQIQIWALELRRGLLTRLTTGGGNRPLWSPDGTSVVFVSGRAGTLDLYQRSLRGQAAEELLLHTDETKAPNDWSSDGGFLLYRSSSLKTGVDLWVLPLQAGSSPMPVVRTEFTEMNGQFSQDIRWIAYQSNESGRFEVYVQPFPGPGDRLQVSTQGGAQPRWRSDGRELFYIGLDDVLMGVSVRLEPNGRTAAIEAPVALFPTSVGGAVQEGFERAQYMVSRDGQRFLMNTVLADDSSSISVLLNWTERRP